MNITIIILDYDFPQEHTSASFHVVLSFVLPILLGFLELKYQGKDTSPFETHPKSMAFAIASSLLYCFAYYLELRSSFVDQKFRACEGLVQGGMVLSGSLLVVSLASILLPGPLGPLLYSFYALLWTSCFVNFQVQML
ncbi:hypothetical protein NMG60_11030260 [Bertholletia excelsa]